MIEESHEDLMIWTCILVILYSICTEHTHLQLCATWMPRLCQQQRGCTFLIPNFIVISADLKNWNIHTTDCSDSFFSVLCILMLFCPCS